MNKLLVAFDTETTGVDPKTAEVVQLAAVSMCPFSLDMNVVFNQLSYPASGVIPKEASEVHGIYFEDLLFQPRDSDSIAAFVALLFVKGLENEVILITYNGRTYDVPVIERHAPSICTYRHIDVYQIVQRTEALFTHGLKLGAVYHGLFKKELKGAHEAVSDVVATLEVFQECLKTLGMTIDQLIDWLDTPQILETCYFGKHAGVKFCDVPKGYLRWVKNNWTELTPDMKLTLETYI